MKSLKLFLILVGTINLSYGCTNRIVNYTHEPVKVDITYYGHAGSSCAPDSQIISAGGEHSFDTGICITQDINISSPFVDGCKYNQHYAYSGACSSHTLYLRDGMSSDPKYGKYSVTTNLKDPNTDYNVYKLSVD